jgi:hypothetical protein
MRYSALFSVLGALLAALLAACGSTGGSTGGNIPDAGASKRVRVVYNQYRGASAVFILENLAGRNLKEMRSQKLPPGEIPVAYVPDDVLERLLDEFRRLDFGEHAVPRPDNPLKLGAKGEITIIADSRRTTLMRLPAENANRKQVQQAQVYVDCAKAFIAVWSAYPPQMQATTSKSAFGVKRAEYER